MRLRAIKSLRRDEAGRVVFEVLRAMALPIPDDVLEQLVYDHGMKEEFQAQYGEIDLHAVTWDLVRIPASKLITCSVYPRFEDWVHTCQERAAKATLDQWKSSRLRPEDAESWQERGTWRRPPVALQRAVLGRGPGLHLVEGHTRLGFLSGLVGTGTIPPTSVHAVWVGRASVAQSDETAWRVLTQERLPFLEWLQDRIGDDGPIHRVADRLIELGHGSTYSDLVPRAPDTSLDDFLSFVRGDRVLAPHEGLIREAHAVWAHGPDLD